MTKPTINLENARTLLRQHAPFNRMDDAALGMLLSKLQFKQFKGGGRILTPRTGAVANLYIVARGLLGSRPNTAQSDPDRTLAPGEMFPVGALSAGGATTRIFFALRDSACYLLAREDFLALRAASPEFERYCTQAITETLKQSLESLYGQYSQRIAEQQSLARTLSEVIRRSPVACPATATLREAARTMDAANVRTIVALDAEAAPVGMFTLVDLLRRVVLPGVSLDVPLAEVMSGTLVTLPSSATAYEAMHVMAERGVRQVVVVDGGRFAGVISERDLFALQRVSLRQVNEGLLDAQTPDELARAAEDIRMLTQNLLAQGVGAEPLTRTIAALNDALSRRLIDLVGLGHDLTGIDWCWLALGSEGRCEQTFSTDQDNALLFVAADEADAAAKRERLLVFAREVNEGLAKLGFPLCTGKVMASNPDLCLSVEEWQGRFLDWIREPTPQALLQANIVFDFRALHGNLGLADDLHEWLLGYTEANPVFLRLMVQNALEVEPPLGLIRSFVVEDGDKGGPATVDLKSRGTRIFVDCARVFALAQGISEAGTALRLRLAAAKLKVDPRHVDATIEGFHFLQMLRLRQQDRGGGINPNRIDPYALNEIDQRVLKESFRQAKQLQERLRLSYRL